VENERQTLSVEVAEGSLAIKSDRLAKPVSLSTGHGFVADRSDQRIRLTAIDPAQVGTWRTGKLQFDNAPLALVAREISRYSGEKVMVDPKIANQPFSGVIAINHGEAPVQSLAQILSLEVKTVDGAVRIQPRRK
jgi:transmembrane sensor